MHAQESLKNHYTIERSWFIVFSVAFIFGLIWTILGESDWKIVFVTVAFIFFVNAGIKMEMSARLLADPHGH